MKLKGTALQIKVWKYLKTIPKGQTRTYKQVAIAIKKPKAILLQILQPATSCRCRRTRCNACRRRYISETH